MSKGNWDNHAKKYAHIEDLNRLEGKLDTFLTNDWPHLVKKIDWMSIRIWIVVGAVTVLVPLVVAIVQALFRQ